MAGICAHAKKIKVTVPPGMYDNGGWWCPDCGALGDKRSGTVQPMTAPTTPPATPAGGAGTEGPFTAPDKREESDLIRQARAEADTSDASLNEWLDYTGKKGGPLWYYPAIQATFEVAITELLALRAERSRHAAVVAAAERVAVMIALIDGPNGTTPVFTEGTHTERTEAVFALWRAQERLERAQKNDAAASGDGTAQGEALAGEADAR